MKYIPLLILISIISCTTGEFEFHYPDCIDRPSDVKVSHGCGNIFVYQFLDSLSAITLYIDESNIQLTKKCQTINLERQHDQVQVRLEKAGTSPDSIYFNYCNDVAYINQGNLKIFNGTKGRVTFSVSEDDPIKNLIYDSRYKVTIVIHDLHLYDETGNLEMIINKIVFWDVSVGWLPG